MDEEHAVLPTTLMRTKNQRWARGQGTASSYPDPHQSQGLQAEAPASTDEREDILTHGFMNAEDGQVDEEPRSSYHDPHQSHGLQAEDAAE